jgi:hypothetical protein
MNKSPKILGLIMAHSTKDPVFVNYKEKWDMLKKGINYPIDFYYLYTKKTGEGRYFVENDCIYSDYEENYWDALLVKVLDGIRFFLENDYDLLFKTNLSSFINFSNFYRISNEIFKRSGPLYSGCQNSIDFGSGAGFMINRESAKIILDNEADFSTKWTDDIFISDILIRKNSVRLTQDFIRYDLHDLGLTVSEDRVRNCSHVRIKVRKDLQDIEYTNTVYNFLKK